MKRQLFLVALVLVAALAGPTGGALAASASDNPSAIDVPTAATNNTTDDTNTTDTSTTATTEDTNTTTTNDTNTTDTNTTNSTDDDTTGTTDDTNTTETTNDTNTTDTNTTDSTNDTNTTDTNTTYSTVPSTCSYPFTSTDATGTSVTVEGAPERIVAVGASTTQTLWEIGAQERVVGLWDSSYTAYLDNASAKPNVAGSYGYANVESVIKRSPDMVLLANVQQNTTAQRLRQAGITVYKFEAASSVDDIYAKTRLIGHLAGNCAGAEDTVSWMQDRLDTVEEVRERADSTPTMFYPMSGSYTAGSGTFVSDVMRLGGAENVALDAGITGYKPYSEGFILKQSPDWLLATYSLPEHGEAESLLPETQEIRKTSAYREGRVVAVNANYLSQPAPRVVYAIENISEAVHPDAWAAVHDTGSAGNDDDDDVDWEDLQNGGSSDSTTNETATNESGDGAGANASAPVSITRTNGSVTATVRNATGTVSFDLVNATAANASVNITASATTNVDTVNATVSNATANATGTVTTNVTALMGATISLRPNVNASELTFTASDPTATAPNATPALDTPNATPMRYFTANVTGVGAEDVDNATLRFSVAPADLPSGTEPSAVVLYRYHNASWDALPTEHLNGSAYAATTPGFSAFAIGSTNATAAGNETTTANETSTSSGSQNGTSMATSTATTETNTSNATTSATSTTSSGSSPGFGPAVAALALALVACLLRRR